MNLLLQVTSTQLFMFLHFRKVNSEIKEFAADKKISTSNKVIKPKKTACKCSGTSSRNRRLPEIRDISCKWPANFSRGIFTTKLALLRHIYANTSGHAEVGSAKA